MTKIIQATSQDLPAVHQLFGEYLLWVHDMLNQEYQVNFDVAAKVEQDMDEIAIFLPPKGRLLLTVEDLSVVGCACSRTIGPDVAELKRMYVRPSQRRKGLGRGLVQALILDLRRTGYRTLRLDTGRFMPEAQALYRSLGFQEIAPYPESELPEDFHKYSIFMELPL